MCAPSYLILQFAYGVGEPPKAENYFVFFGPLLCLGLVFGLGLLLIGFPKLISGQRTPVSRVFAGVLLIVSAGGLLLVGVDGSMTRIVTPVFLLFEIVLFAVFVWPARPFATNP